MRDYYHEASYHKAQHYRRVFKRILIIVVVVAGVAGVSIAGDSVWQKIKEQDQKSTSTLNSGYYSAPLKIFRTPFFQFQTDDSWSEVTSEPQPNVYVYRSQRQQFVDHELTVYVNTPKPNLSATRVLPINITSSGELLPLKVSGHCSEFFKPTEPKSIKLVKMDEVEFLCDPNDSLYRVVLGIRNGGTNMALARPDKTKANFVILYRNITATPEASKLVQIAETFQTR